VATTYSAKLDINDQNVIRGFIEWFGTAYSFFLALALVNVWSQFETVERELDRELDSISTLLQTTEYLKASNKKNNSVLNKFKDAIHEDVKRYITHVIKNHKYEHLVSQQHQNGDRILQDVGNRIGDLARMKIITEPFVYELFRSLNEAVDVRGDRITHSKPYAPVIVQLVALASSVIWLISFFGLVVYDLLVSLVLIGGVTFVIIMVLIIFFDLSDPFGGIWRIKLEEWYEFQETIEHNPNPQVLFVYSINSKFIGRFRFLIGLDKCKLNSFANSGFLGLAWIEFIKRAEKNRANVNRAVKCITLHSDQLSYYGYDVHIKSNERPLVVLKQGKDFSVLLDVQEIKDCRDLIEFEELFNKKMREAILWF